MCKAVSHSAELCRIPRRQQGHFRILPMFNFSPAIMGKPQPESPNYYADTAVIAYRAPGNDVPISSLNPKITSSGGTIDVALLSDDIRHPMCPRLMLFAKTT